MSKTNTPEKTPQFKRAQPISVPQLKLQVDNPVFIEIATPIKEIEIKDNKGEISKCPCVNVIDLIDRQIKQLLLDMIPADCFMEFGDKLVGTQFEMTKHQKVQSGKNGYHPFTIYTLAQ